MKTDLSVIFCCILILLNSCSEDKAQFVQFKQLSSSQSQINFQNTLEYTPDYNPYTYRNFYNGGGVGLGDINNDGLLDIYFTGNLVPNKLYLNKGDLVFEDITEKAGVACEGVWSTGVNFVDINGDDLLDIYVCKGGKPDGENRYNELFINNGDLSFTESAAAYGLDVVGLSIQSSFFDYDQDGDLDCYLLNNSIRSVGGFDMKEGLRNEYDPEGNKLFENRDGKFIDVTQEAGIYSSSIGYGLGITLADFNLDGWTDIFLSNDFFEKDYLYINQQDGTFSEKIDEQISSLSMGSMGADAADLDNDLLPDIFVTEMLPKDDSRKLTKTVYENWDKYQLAIEKGYGHQFARNVLQKNLGNNQFVELGRWSGVEDTDWSWSALIQDFDNDGLKDLFVSNGIKSDLLDKDYLNFFANDVRVKSMIDQDEDVLTKLIDAMPSQKLTNAYFKNQGELKFEYLSDEVGLGLETFSNGSAYGDLDNDGDLDLVLNNVDDEASIFINQSTQKNMNSIAFRLKYKDQNLKGIGTKINLISDSLSSMMEYFPAKGFQSTSNIPLFFGLGNRIEIDSILVTWPDGVLCFYESLSANEIYNLDYSDCKRITPKNVKVNKVDDFVLRTQKVLTNHKEPKLNHFNREPLLLSMVGFSGPSICTADINSDGVDDLFVGGGKNQESVLLVSNGSEYRVQNHFTDTKASEVVASSFFDSDNDGDLDLFISHGGKSFSIYAPELHDVLYINNGEGKFAKAKNAVKFPRPISSGDHTIVDLNKDGYLDLIIGEAYKTDLHGLPGDCLVFLNNQNNTFSLDKDLSQEKLGMITAVEYLDVNKDGWEDLIVAGQWMPIIQLINQEGKSFRSAVINSTSGLWNSIEKSDIDQDGDLDLILGNQGQNSFYKEGLHMFINDFDKNGRPEQLVCREESGDFFPVHDVDEVFSQLSFLKRDFQSYEKYSEATLQDLVNLQNHESTVRLSLEELSSIMLRNNEGQLEIIKLPSQAQYSSVHGILPIDHNGDGIMDLYLGGNEYRNKSQVGRQDASMGWVCFGQKHGDEINFSSCDALGIQGEIRALRQLSNGNIIVGINNGPIKLYE